MTQDQNLRLLRGLQDALPRLEYGDYSWTLDDQLVLEAVPDLGRSRAGASYRIDGASPWVRLRVPRWRRCTDCPLLDGRGWRRQECRRLPQPELDLRRDDGALPFTEPWARGDEACFLRCLVRRIEEITGTEVGVPGTPGACRRRPTAQALVDWGKAVEAALTPDPCRRLGV